MPLDGIMLNFIKNEISSSVIGSRVEKIHQPSREELVLHMRGKNGAKKIFLSVRASSPRVNFTENPPDNPSVPPMFCMLMRKHLTNAMLSGIRQFGLDRVLYFDFDATNEIGDKIKLTLSIEIMSKHSNILLIGNDGKIIDAIKRTDFASSSARPMLPGFKYTVPEKQDKINLFEGGFDLIYERIKSFGNKTISSAILSSIQGVSPLTSREIAQLSGGDCIVSQGNDKIFAEIMVNIGILKNSLVNGNGTAYILIDSSGKPMDFSFMEITQYGKAVKLEKEESYSALLDKFYFERDRIERNKQKANDLIKFLNNSISRTAKKLNSQKAELSSCADREHLRICAELINASLYKLSKGVPFYDIENYYDNNNMLRIKADPAISPAENAQRYFKNYRKAKNAELILVDVIKSGEDDLQYLETVLDELSRASTSAETEEIRNELIASGYLRLKQKSKKSKPPKSLPPMEYFSSDGFKISVGRNNVQNDKLSLKQADKKDMWLHTQKIPGSHVIITADGKDISEKAIVEAAEIAAYNSKARDGKTVPVDYTLVKNLKKPQGSKPGKVIYHVYNTVIVDPKKPNN